jgi:hypothetical protein
MLKEMAIELCDLIADACKRRARKWVERSQWWADAAEAIETGVSIEEIRRGRPDDADA